MLLLGMLGGMLYAGIPALLKTRFNANEILTSLMLVYVAQLFLDWLVRGAWRDPRGSQFPEDDPLSPAGSCCRRSVGRGRAHWGFVFAIIAAIAALVHDGRMLKGLRGQRARQARGQGASPASPRPHGLVLLPAVGRACRACRHLRSGGRHRPAAAAISPGYGFTAIIVAFLGRLNPLGIIVAGLVLALTYLGGEAAQSRSAFPTRSTRLFQGMLLFFVLACDTLIHYRSASSGVRSRRRTTAQEAAMGIFEAILLTIITASTPLLIAAIGELVTERSGVLNLGVEGMMVMGAVGAFAAAS